MSVLWAAVMYAQLQLVLDDSLKAPNGIDFPPSSLLSFFFLCVTLAAALGGPAMVLPVHNKTDGRHTRESRKKDTDGQPRRPHAHTSTRLAFLFFFHFVLATLISVGILRRSFFSKTFV
jgi:hypothetical protein